MMLRREVLDIIKCARRGHIASAFSIIEILMALYDGHMNYRAQQPNWDERDRFILSKGHGCLSLYVMLANKGFFPREELSRFCEKDSILGGHPEYGKIPGVEFSTGSLGHGLSVGVGIALFGKMKKKDFRTYVLLGDGECNEGSVWEAALSALKHKLNNLIILIDYNKMQSYSFTKEVIDLEPFAEKWDSFGFFTQEINGHNIDDICKALSRSEQEREKPSAIICHTIKGKGIAFIENDATWHHKSKITDAELEVLYEGLNVQ